MLRQYTGPETPALNEDERRRVPVLVALLVLISTSRSPEMEQVLYWWPVQEAIWSS